MKPKVIFILVVILLFLIILIQNTQVVTLRLFFWEAAMSQIILIPLIMIIGFVVGYFVAKLKGSNRTHKTSSKQANREIPNSKSGPVDG
ncbi:MAG: LapA family protein [Desulfatiglandales bacterium]